MRFTGREATSTPGEYINYLNCEGCNHDQTCIGPNPNVPKVKCNRCKKTQEEVRRG